MNDDQNQEHAENIKLLKDLCDAILLPGSYVIDFGPDKAPAIAVWFEGATGVALPMVTIDMKDPIIKKLVLRAISEKKGGLITRPTMVMVNLNKKRNYLAKVITDTDASPRPAFVNTVNWYYSFKDAIEIMQYDDDEILDGLWQFLNGDWSFWMNFVLQLTQKMLKKEKALDYPKVPMDSTSARDLFKVFKEKGLFGKKIDDLKTSDNILNTERARLGKESVDDLTANEQRKALARERFYRNGNYIYTDFGNFSIGFNIKLYGDYLISQKNDLLKKQTEPFLFDELNEEIDEALENIASYKIAYELAYIVLAEAAAQKKLTNLYISYEKILHYLQEPTSNKTIYRKIRDGFHALRYLDYVLWDYSNITPTKIERAKKDGDFFMTGNFIYNYGEDAKGVYIDVNEKFAGCALKVIDSDQQSKQMFTRGYHWFPTISLGMTRRAGTSVAFLTNRLFAETGNDTLNTESHKVITPAVPAGETLCEWASIQHGRANRRWSELLKTLAKVDIIDKIEPSLATLRKMKPSTGMKEKIRIYIKSDVNAIDADLKEKNDRRRRK